MEPIAVGFVAALQFCSSLGRFAAPFFKPAAFAVLATVVAWTAVPACALAQDADAPETTIAWRLAADDLFQVKVTQSSNRQSQLDSRVTVVETQVDLEFDWRVLSVGDDGLATIEQVLQRFSVSVVDPAVPGQAIQYASDADQSQLSGAMRKLLRKAKPLVGLKCKFQMQPNGKVTSVNLSDPGKAALKKLPDSSKLRSLFSSESIKQTLEQVSLALPADAKPGARWKSKDSNDTAFGKVDLQHDHEIGNVDDNGLVKIVSRLKWNADDSADDQPAGEGLLAVLSLTGGGSMSFDTRDGYFKASQTQRTVSTSRKYREKTILTSVKSETRFKIQKK